MNQISALNVSTTEEVLPLNIQRISQLKKEIISSQFKKSQKSSQVKSNEELIKTLHGQYFELFSKLKCILRRDGTRASMKNRVSSV